MKIGIDCRLYGPKHTGIGRYTQNLVENLLEIDKENSYVFFMREKGEIGGKTVILDIPHYSLREQILFPQIINKENLDLMHFPHFNVPFFYRGKYIVTIHDLIKHSSKGVSTTTQNPIIYWLKYLGYKFVFRQAVKRAEKIFTPSLFIKGELIKQYKINKDKIVVTYEGVGKSIKSNEAGVELIGNEILKKYDISKPYLLYVGNVYPHKNIEKLVEAVKRLQTKDFQLQLVVVCARNVFSERLSKIVIQLEAGSFVKMVGFVPDGELTALFKEAEAFVFPTLSEGFGLPGLEAMTLGCPVICSDIPVLKEIYRDAALYFDPESPVDIAEKIKKFLSDEELRKNLKKIGLKLAESYSWSKMAKETFSVYRSSS